MEYLNWNSLGSFAGAVFAVGVLTQITKNIPGIAKLPTQLWSYLISLATLLLTQVFTDGITVPAAVISLFNAALVSLSANGGYQALLKMKDSFAAE